MPGNQYTLASLARELDLKALEEWEAAKGDERRAILRGDAAPVVTGAGLTLRVEPSEAERCRARAASALARLQDLIRTAIASGRYAVHGTGPDLSRQSIAPDMASELFIDDPTDNTLRTAGGYIWRSVGIRRRTARGRIAIERKPGSGNTAFDDSALVARALDGMDGRKYKSALAAASALRSEIDGNGTADSKIRRLAKKIREADAAR